MPVRATGREDEHMKVADLMTKNVMACRSDEPLSAACKIMWECDCGTVPVLAADGDRVIGVITDRDICMCCWMRSAPPQQLQIADAMSKELHSASPDDTVAQAARIMRAHQIRRLPVVDRSGRLVGILSLADIVREAERGGDRRDRDLAAHEITSTLANIVHTPPAAQPHH
jgi:CBS domain-containing protein